MDTLIFFYKEAKNTHPLGKEACLSNGAGWTWYLYVEECK